MTSTLTGQIREAVDIEPSPRWARRRTMPELIEAAVRYRRSTGSPDAPSCASPEPPRAGDTDWGLGLEARSRALLSDGEVADNLYREAIVRLGRTRVGSQLARAHLLYGEWLRRERRRVDARDQLRTALELFTSIGAEAFVARADMSCWPPANASGRRVEPCEDLTAQEAQIARLAREGLSNAEIGARLFKR